MKSINRFIPGFLVKRCPKSGRIVKLRFDNIYTKLAFPIVGIFAIIWFLVRVIPKPSRVAYPCQQAAVGIGGGFLLYVISIVTSLSVYQEIRKRINKPVALVFIGSVAMLISLTWVVADSSKVVFVPTLINPEGSNAPMGEAKGIFPGRVVWTHDLMATSWDERNGMWWDDNNTNQSETDKMMSATLQNLTGIKTDKEAWQKLFEYNNKQNGRGKKSYEKGEKIVIKINMNALHLAENVWKNQGYPSPQMLNSLITQLIEVAGVSGEDIIITDPSRFIGDKIIDRIHGNKSPEFAKVIFEGKFVGNLPNCRIAEPDTSALV